jgi:hypothetical protein
MVINQMERMWKEAVLAYLQILASHFSGEVEWRGDKSQTLLFELTSLLYIATSSNDKFNIVLRSTKW